MENCNADRIMSIREQNVSTLQFHEREGGSQGERERGKDRNVKLDHFCGRHVGAFAPESEASLKVTSIILPFLLLVINHLVVRPSSQGANEIYIDHLFLWLEDGPAVLKKALSLIFGFSLGIHVCPEPVLFCSVAFCLSFFFFNAATNWSELKQEL